MTAAARLQITVLTGPVAIATAATSFCAALSDGAQIPLLDLYCRHSRTAECTALQVCHPSSASRRSPE